MKDTLAPGLAHTGELTVTADLTVPEVSENLPALADMPPVFATAMMVGFLEATCIEAIAPHLDDAEHSVGTHINVSHIAATPAGMTVRAEVRLTRIDRRMLTFKVEAFDNAGLIGKGSHQRAIVDKARFVAKAQEKAMRI